jgi:hypothetical protein
MLSSVLGVICLAVLLFLTVAAVANVLFRE